MKVWNVVLLASAIGGSAAHGAPVQWTVGSGGNGHYYEFIAGTDISWNTARGSALSAGGYLATITSAAENTFVAALVTAGGVRGWLGGSDAAVEGTFRWMDGPEAGNLLTYTNFPAGEPNNFGDEDYLEMFGVASAPFGVGQWNDLVLGGTAVNGYVVEYDTLPSSVPEPSTFALALGGLAGWVMLRRRG